MKKLIMIAALALLLGSVSYTTAIAKVGENDKPLVSVTPYLGYGNWDTDLQTDDSFVYGGRGAIHFLRWLSVEGTYGLSSTNNRAGTRDVDMTHMGVDLVAELFPSRKFNPYVTAGWAQLNHEAAGLEKEYLNGWEAGVGAKIRLGGDNASYRALRLEVRDVMSDFSEVFPNYGETKHSLIATAGLQFAFGKGSRDSDGDGVRDRDDACEGTPAGAMIDASGCPTDSDGDGVFDGIDQCEGTNPNLQVDMSGCPIAVTEIEEQLLDTGRISTNNIVFATSSHKLDTRDTNQLDEVGEALSNWPQLRVEIGGHTDSTGSESFNQQLSEKRAQSVLDYLVANFPKIVPVQYTVVGYGEAEPVADNATAEGRAANRRVEFKVLNNEELKKQIEKRRMLER